MDEAVQSIVSIPVYYGLDVGLDLEMLAEEKNLQVQEVIDLHVKELYSVFATSRLANPRKSVPKGSVAIADRQTAIYPLQSPGGWKILGRTPKAMFDVRYDGLSLLHVGDKVRFEPISKEQFLMLGGEL